MKKFLLLTAGLALGMSAMAQTPFQCVADTWIRSNNLKFTGGTSDKVEVRMDALKDADNTPTGEYAYFVALYGFNYQLPTGKKVQEATLRLVTERWKGSNVTVYGYSNNFDEATASWETEGSYAEAALLSGEITNFSPAGQRNIALGTNPITNDDYKALGAWTNEINVTNYLKSLPATATRVNFLLAQTDRTNVNQNCFFTKEREGVVDAEDASLNFSQAEIIPMLYVTFVDDADSSLDVLSPIADTFVRSSAGNNNYATSKDMEIYTQTTDDGTNYFVGLMNFSIPSELLSDKYELTGAALRLVTVQCKGSREMGIYEFGSFAENATWNSISEQVLAAIAEDPVETFEVAGQGNKALNEKDKISEAYTTVDAWTNNIDLTDYVQSVIDSKSTNVSFAIAKINAQTTNDAVRFATKESEGATGLKDDETKFTFPAEDLVPQLTVAYSKVSSGEGGGESSFVFTIDSDNAPVEYFNLNGVKVVNPDKGIYIVRQGNSVKKVVL